MSESKIPWPIWAAVMLACAVIAAWASDLQRKISSLEAQLNPPQPTYSPSVSEPSPSPTAILTSTPTITTEPTPTSTPTSERTPSLSDPKWDYSVFNSTVDTAFSYKMIEEPAFNQQNQQVEWIVEFSIPREAELS
ncbi:MAG: hypothetical protein ACKPKW_29345, partial [Dolichospermum sp.]